MFVNKGQLVEEPIRWLGLIPPQDGVAHLLFFMMVPASPPLKESFEAFATSLGKQHLVRRFSVNPARGLPLLRCLPCFFRI